MADNALPEIPAAEKSISTGVSRLEDKSVRVPDAIKRAAAAADAIHAQVYRAAPVDAPAGDAPKPAGEPPAPKSDSATPPADPPVAPAAPASKDVDNALRSANGRISAQQKQMNEMREYIQALETQLRSAAPAKPEPADDPSMAITPKEVEEYGEEFLSIVERKARQIAAPKISELERRVEELGSKLGQVETKTVRTDRQNMVAYLDANITNWRAINEADDFNDWLDLQEPYSGIIKRSVLERAWNANNTATVAKLFNGFVAEKASKVPPKPNEPAPVTSEVKRPTLQDFAAPGRASHTGDPSQSPDVKKPIVTRDYIRKFHDAVAKGVYNGKDAEKTAIDVAIFEALREGRVQ